VILAMYGSAVATGVAREKTPRTAEVLISAMRPEDLLAGKVIGIGTARVRADRQHVLHADPLLSFVPPLTPALMPARIAVGAVAWWEVILGVLIMLASIYGMVQLATRIYKATLVRSGPRLSWREALRVRPQ
jgi:ABC-type Na+ efflux pump permease subunit